MNMHKNARLTPRGRERIVRQVATPSRRGIRCGRWCGQPEGRTKLMIEETRAPHGLEHECLISLGAPRREAPDVRGAALGRPRARQRAPHWVMDAGTRGSHKTTSRVL